MDLAFSRHHAKTVTTNLFVSRRFFHFIFRAKFETRDNHLPVMRQKPRYGSRRKTTHRLGLLVCYASFRSIDLPVEKELVRVCSISLAQKQNKRTLGTFGCDHVEGAKSQQLLGLLYAVLCRDPLKDVAGTRTSRLGLPRIRRVHPPIESIPHRHGKKRYHSTSSLPSRSPIPASSLLLSSSKSPRAQHCRSPYPPPQEKKKKKHGTDQPIINQPNDRKSTQVKRPPFTIRQTQKHHAARIQGINADTKPSDIRHSHHTYEISRKRTRTRKKNQTSERSKGEPETPLLPPLPLPLVRLLVPPLPPLPPCATDEQTEPSKRQVTKT